MNNSVKRRHKLRVSKLAKPSKTGNNKQFSKTHPQNKTFHNSMTRLLNYCSATNNPKKVVSWCRDLE